MIAQELEATVEAATKHVDRAIAYPVLVRRASRRALCPSRQLMSSMSSAAVVGHGNHSRRGSLAVKLTDSSDPVGQDGVTPWSSFRMAREEDAASVSTRANMRERPGRTPRLRGTPRAGVPTCLQVENQTRSDRRRSLESKLRGVQTLAEAPSAADDHGVHRVAKARSDERKGRTFKRLFGSPLRGLVSPELPEQVAAAAPGHHLARDLAASLALPISSLGTATPRGGTALCTTRGTQLTSRPGCGGTSSTLASLSAGNNPALRAFVDESVRRRGSAEGGGGRTARGNFISDSNDPANQLPDPHLLPPHLRHRLPSAHPLPPSRETSREQLVPPTSARYQAERPPSPHSADATTVGSPAQTADSPAQHMWSQLPPSFQSAASTLGYDQWLGMQRRSRIARTSAVPPSELRHQSSSSSVFGPMRSSRLAELVDTAAAESGQGLGENRVNQSPDDEGKETDSPRLSMVEDSKDTSIYI